MQNRPLAKLKSRAPTFFFTDLVLWTLRLWQILHCGHVPFKDYLSVMNGGIVGLCTLQTAANPDVLGQGWSCCCPRDNAQQEEHNCGGGGGGGGGTSSSSSSSGTSGSGSETDAHVQRVSDDQAHTHAHLLLPRFLASSSSDQGRGLQPIYRCMGLGIVRAVDPDTRKVYIVTPLDEESLADVDLLVKGDLQVRRRRVCSVYCCIVFLQEETYR